MFNYLILSLLVVTPVMGLFYTNLFYAWLILELVTVFFVVLSFFLKLSHQEIILKYFFIQSLASSGFLFFTLVFGVESEWYSYFCTMLILAMLAKLGFFPFHFWFPYVAYNVNWMLNYFLFTSQKFIPFVLLMCFGFSLEVLFIIMISLFITTLMQLNSFELKVFFAYSSLNHGVWLMLSGVLDKTMFFIYFFFYLVMISFMVWHFLNNNYENKFYVVSFNYTMFIMMLSLSGLPPLLGFYVKWGVMVAMLSYSLFIFLLVYINLMTGFYSYLRVFYYNISFELKLKTLNKNYGYFFNMFQLVPLFCL